MIDTRTPWYYTYNEGGGYNCMSDAIFISSVYSSYLNYIFKLDLADFGQRSCEPPTPEVLTNAMAIAKKIVDAVNSYSPKTTG